MTAAGGEPTERERACFEAGIKLGALYHQWVGAPISTASAGTLERAIEASVGEQRYVEDVDVAIDGITENRYGYTELVGTMLDVSLDVAIDGASVEAGIAEEDGYPMMRIHRVD